MRPGIGEGSWKTRPRLDQSGDVGVVRPLRRVCKHIPKLKDSMTERGEEKDSWTLAPQGLACLVMDNDITITTTDLLMENFPVTLR